MSNIMDLNERKLRISVDQGVVTAATITNEMPQSLTTVAADRRMPWGLDSKVVMIDQQQAANSSIARGLAEHRLPSSHEGAPESYGNMAKSNFTFVRIKKPK